jgi:hypothetical protein
MQEYTIHRSSRKCHQSDRPFQPNERYYSVVLPKGSDLVRHDFSKEHWNGPPNHAIGWWISQMPAKQTGKLQLAPTHVLLDTLERLCEEPENSELAYLLSILMVRRRILTERHDEPNSDEPTHLHVTHGADQREWLVPIQPPHPDRVESLHQKLIDLLYCES